MRELIIRDSGALTAYRELASFLTKNRKAYVNFRKAIKNGLCLFVARPGGLSAGGTMEKVVLLKPSDSFNNLVAAIRAGDRDLHLFVRDFLRHSCRPTERASVTASSARERA
jgi:hypothetical protein